MAPLPDGSEAVTGPVTASDGRPGPWYRQIDWSSTFWTIFLLIPLSFVIREDMPLSYKVVGVTGLLGFTCAYTWAVSTMPLWLDLPEGAGVVDQLRPAAGRLALLAGIAAASAPGLNGWYTSSYLPYFCAIVLFATTLRTGLIISGCLILLTDLGILLLAPEAGVTWAAMGFSLSSIIVMLSRFGADASARREAEGRELAAAAEREERARYARREAARKTELATASDVEAAARVALEAAERALSRAAAERDRLSERRSQVSQEVSDARRALDRLSAELSEATASAHQGQIAAEQTRLRVEDLQRRALEELSLEPEQLLAEFGPETLVPMLPLDPDEVDKAAAAEPSAYVRAEQERALAKAQKDLEKLGRVNPLALEEHEALASRHKFLVDQVQDLKQSKADLLRIVQDVDRLVEEAFASAFAETREQFEHVFGVLFPGGHGDLVLTEPDDMLSTGIEIEARPAGKKVKRLSLLSGGERSLAAIAFLVAIFKARPSPFYVMDEVEAALDDVNLTRLLAIFKELQETSQLIVITHQKRTMEIADALYGVTMRDGVTTVVSQRLAD